MTPQTQEVEAFTNWVTTNGGEVMAPLNEWEVWRIRAQGKTFICYRDKTGRFSYPKAVEFALINEAFQRRVPLPLSRSVKHRPSSKARKDAIIARDGNECWYCETSFEETGSRSTIDEVCSRQAGGPRHLANQVLACESCNLEAGNLDVAAKVKLRERKRTMNWGRQNSRPNSLVAVTPSLTADLPNGPARGLWAQASGITVDIIDGGGNTISGLALSIGPNSFTVTRVKAATGGAVLAMY